MMTNSWESLRRWRMLGTVVWVLCLPAAQAQQEKHAPDNFPAKPITVVVPFPAGGPTDVSARLFAKLMADVLGQPIIVDNRAGAAGTLGSAFVARAPADGYTLLWGGTSTLAVAPSLYTTLKYDARSFVPIGMALRGQLMLAGHPSLPTNDVSQLLALAKTRSLTVGSAGTGSLGHLATEYLRDAASVSFTHVPYRGGSPAMTDALGGQIDLVFDTASALAPHVRSGKLRAYAVTGNTPYQPLPRVPLMSSVVPSYQAYAWFGLVAPVGTPPEVLQRLRSAMDRAAATPEVKRELVSMGVEAGVATASEFAKVIAADSAKWAGIVRRADVKAEE